LSQVNPEVANIQKTFIMIADTLPKRNTRGRKPWDFDEYVKMAQEKLVMIAEEKRGVDPSTKRHYFLHKQYLR
jgi:hypothetical protein